MKRIVTLLISLMIVAPFSAAAAEGVLYMSPERGTYPIDDEFEVNVLADTDGEAAFAAEADIAFNPQSLAVQRISTDGSVLKLWPTPPEFSNTKGTIRFSGTAEKSFSGESAVLVTITFRAIGVHAADIQIESGAILKNDARAMNIITAMRSANFTIVARELPPAPASAPEAGATASTTELQVPEVKGASIQVPNISGYDDRVTAGERIILQGSGSPDSQITVYLQHDEDTPVESTLYTTRDGSFTYVGRDKAERGMYRAWVTASGNSETFKSDTVIITAGSNGVAAVSESVGPMLLMALPYLLALIAAGVSLGYWYNRRAAGKTIGSR